MLFRNRSAAFLWGFALVWLAMLIAFTLVAVRDGAPEGYSMAAIAVVLGLFWLGGAGLFNFAMTKPCYFASIAPETGLTLVWRYPHKRIAKTFSGDCVAAPVVAEEKDSEGDPYFIARLRLPDGTTFDIAESHDRDRCDQACQAFTDALNQYVGERKRT